MESEIQLDVVQGDVRFSEYGHTYTHIPTNRQLASVSEVIRIVYGAKSWTGVDERIVENARNRGVAVDRYLSEYIERGTVRIENQSADIAHRVVAAQRIFEDQFRGQPAQSQVIVWSLEDGVAGTIDFWVDRRVLVDLKCTYNLEHSVVLQLGAYATYCDPNPERVGIIHVNPKIYKEGARWIEYDVVSCKTFWADAVYWWHRTKKLNTARAIRVK